MSILTWGGVQYGPAGWLTLSFNQEAVRDGSETDYMYTKITITGDFLLSKPIEPEKTSGGATPAASLPILRASTAFMRQRQQLSFKVNGTELIPHTSTVDAKSGPMPMYFNVTTINEATFLCSLQIVSHWADVSNEESGGIVSHRWSENVEIDRDFFTTHTRQGKVVVASSAYNSARGLMIDKLRETLVTTSIEPGFVRESSVYTVHESGLELGYTLRDREQFRLPPAPATTADGDYTITTQRMGSVGRTATCRIALKGPKKQEANPLVLTKLATAIAYQKLRSAGTFFPTQATFHEKLYENSVDVTISGRLNQKKAKTFNLLVGTNAIGAVPFGSDPVTAKSPDPGTRGTANLLLHAAAYGDPTLGQTLNRKDNSLVIAKAVSPSSGLIPGG